MSVRGDFKAGSVTQQDLNPLHPPQYKDMRSCEKNNTSSTLPTGPQNRDSLQESLRAGRRRSLLTSVSLTACLLTVSLLAVPLWMLWTNGIFSDGAWRYALAGSARPGPDKKAFPTNIGFAGPTATGKEAGLIVTAPHLPLQTAQPPLVIDQPSSGNSKHKHTENDKNFNMLQLWGQLSPWYSVESHGLKRAKSVQPEGCKIVGMHWLQRHGARYPGGGFGATLEKRLQDARPNWKATGSLAFLNEWEHKLGAEVLTPFGRQQLFDLGVSARLKYGFLLDKFTDRLPVLRTESQDRMLKSAQNFASGFFGIPAEDQYNLEVMVEAPGYNCTLAPYLQCANDNAHLARVVREKSAVWENHFLKHAQKRLGRQTPGYNLSMEDVKDMMDMCPWETVALGYSSFCDVFTVEEWKGFQHLSDIGLWYGASFGSPVARASGIGYVQELVSRLTHTRITVHNSTTNSSFHNDIQFPLNDALYIDFTHDTTFAQLLPTLNLTSFAASGPPPLDHIPRRKSFVSSEFCSFATNLQFQVLACNNSAHDEPTHIRLILNDGVVPLTGIRGCPDDDDGKCPLVVFISALKEMISEVDFSQECGIKGRDLSLNRTTGSPAANRWDSE